MRKIFCVLLCTFFVAVPAIHAQQWTKQQAKKWYKKQGWLRGCNFQPSTAINQLEMFQAETFDTATIDKELGWAEELGFNVMRVYLHHLLWTSDAQGFKKRLDTYLDISTKHSIKTLFVIFDDCWNDTAFTGKQPAPKTGVHNSGWVRDPGTMIYTHPDTMRVLEAYVKDLLSTFKDDKRVLLWDLYNEPGNSGQVNKSMPLLQNVFSWARQVQPSQPVTSGVWNDDTAFARLNKFQLENSDVITYHNYRYVDVHKKAIDSLKQFGRPLICTEYMARTNGSLFFWNLPLLKKENIGAINWGFVKGKTNTVYAWSNPMPGGAEPDLWFHDIFRQDHSAFSEEEVAFIKKMCRGKR